MFSLCLENMVLGFSFWNLSIQNFWAIWTLFELITNKRLYLTSFRRTFIGIKHFRQPLHKFYNFPLNCSSQEFRIAFIIIALYTICYVILFFWMIKHRSTSLWNFIRMYLLGKLIALDTSPLLGIIEILAWVLNLHTQIYTLENWWYKFFVHERHKADVDLFWTFPYDLLLA